MDLYFNNKILIYVFLRTTLIALIFYPPHSHMNAIRLNFINDDDDDEEAEKKRLASSNYL